MKAITLLSLVLTSALSLASLRADEAASFQVKVPEMTCSNCAWSVTEELKKVEHVTEVFVDPKTKVDRPEFRGSKRTRNFQEGRAASLTLFLLVLTPPLPGSPSRAHQ